MDNEKDEDVASVQVMLGVNKQKGCDASHTLYLIESDVIIYCFLKVVFILL